jgi:hypothetical protein
MTSSAETRAPTAVGPREFGGAIRLLALGAQESIRGSGDMACRRRHAAARGAVGTHAGCTASGESS